MNRRRFVKATLVAGAVSLLRACGVRVQPTAPPPGDTAVPFTTPQRTQPATPASPTAVPTTAPKILQDENREGFFIRYYRPFAAPDREAWRLRVEGLVASPVEFNYQSVLDWPSAAQVSRLKCVECWSAKAKWEGFTYDTLAEIVNPSPLATHIRFECEDAYWEVIAIEELRQPRALFVLKMNHELLPDEYGAPLRMIVPWKYGYKGAKAVHILRFQDQGGPGYWSTVGPYTVSGDIVPGVDHPLDLPGGGRSISGGEITDY